MILKLGTKKSILWLLSAMLICISFIPLIFFNIPGNNFLKDNLFRNNALCVVFWFLIFWLIRSVARDERKKYKWLLIFLPFVFGIIFEMLFVFALWKINGFAP